MRLFINSLAASAGGGLTYIRNVIPHLAVVPGVQVTVAVSPGLREEFRKFGNVDFVELEVPPARRFWYEQSALPAVIRRCGADVLLSAGNFALRKSPVPQVLLSRNSIYTSADFYRDLRSRHEYRSWLDTHLRAWLAKKSIQWADITVAPSEAFAAELHRWTGMPIRAIHHGFDYEAFSRDSSPLSVEVRRSFGPPTDRREDSLCQSLQLLPKLRNPSSSTSSSAGSSGGAAGETSTDLQTAPRGESGPLQS